MKTENEFKYAGPAIYQICLLGHLDENLQEMLGGMKINFFNTRRNLITTLTGELIAQSAFNEVLNTLYENHYKILSVLKNNYITKSKH